MVLVLIIIIDSEINMLNIVMVLIFLTVPHVPWFQSA